MIVSTVSAKLKYSTLLYVCREITKHTTLDTLLYLVGQWMKLPLIPTAKTVIRLGPILEGGLHSATHKAISLQVLHMHTHIHIQKLLVTHKINKHNPYFCYKVRWIASYAPQWCGLHLEQELNLFQWVKAHFSTSRNWRQPALYRHIGPWLHHVLICGTNSWQAVQWVGLNTMQLFVTYSCANQFQHSLLMITHTGFNTTKC